MYRSHSLTAGPLAAVLLAALLISLLLAGASTPARAQSTKPTITLTPKSFPKWLAFIRPTDDELAYERIGWRNAFWPAVEEAKRLGRPILLWTMNGHPLGCT